MANDKTAHWKDLLRKRLASAKQGEMMTLANQ